MKKFTLTIISLLLVGIFDTSTAWAQQESFGGGDGTATSPYLISTADHWNQLASDVSAGTSYSGKYFQLATNISVSTLIGTGTNGNNAKSFSGTFDGNGKTLTFNYTATDDVANAPFRFLNNATIKNLHVDGTITTSYRHASGLAGRTYGTTLIQGCRVSTVILSSVAGDATHGGIVVMKPDWKNAHLTLEGCVFDGKIVSTGTTASTHCGGLVGYTSYGSLTLSNCIYAPADDANLVTSERSLYRFLASGPGTITINNYYYSQTNISSRISELSNNRNGRASEIPDDSAIFHITLSAC